VACRYNPGPPEQASFNVAIVLEEASVPPGSDYRLSVYGDVDGPWIEADIGPEEWVDDLVFFEYVVRSEVQTSTEGGCQDPIFLQLRGQVEEDGVVVRPDLLVGRFVGGVLFATYQVTDWDPDD